MDKQDELAAFLIPLVDSIEFRTAVGSCRTQFGKPEDMIAAAVRSFMGSEEVRKRAAIAVSRADDERLADGHADGFQHEEISDWSLFVADAALSAAIGEDIGGLK